MLEKYGYTRGCEGCWIKRAGLSEPRSHSEACRARILEAMDGDEEGKEKKGREQERVEKRLAEHMEENAEKEKGFKQEDPRTQQEREIFSF